MGSAGAGKALVMGLWLAVAHGQAADPDQWLEFDSTASVPQVGTGELLFLTSAPDDDTLQSSSRIGISAESLHDGWVALEQCYRRLDPVPETEIVYRYRRMRDLRVVDTDNIASATVDGDRVQLEDVGRDAALCVQADVQILYRLPDGKLELRNGPFMRRFLDGYFPMHVALRVRFPAALLDYVSVSPAPQPGFAVLREPGRIDIDAWFAGTLSVAVRFTPRTAHQ